MRNDANLDPRRWMHQMGTHLDAGTELFEGTCTGCGHLQGVRIVMEDPKVALAGSFLLLCTNCLVFDHPRRSYAWELVAIRERARFAAHEELVPV